MHLAQVKRDAKMKVVRHNHIASLQPYSHSRHCEEQQLVRILPVYDSNIGSIGIVRVQRETPNLCHSHKYANEFRFDMNRT